MYKGIIEKVLFLYLLSTFLGSAFIFFGVGVLTPMNILLPFSIVCCYLVLFSGKIKLNFFNFLLVCTPPLLLLLGLVYVIFGGADVVLTTYLVHMVVISHIFFLIYNRRINVDFYLLVAWITVVTFYVCIVQFLFIYGFIGSTYGILLKKEIWGVYAVTGGFGNPNNQSMVCCILAAILCLWFRDDKNRSINEYYLIILFFMNILVVLITASRVSIVISIIWCGYILKCSGKARKFSILLAPVIFYYIWVNIEYLESFSLLMYRFESLLAVITGGADGSVDGRLSNYIYILGNIHKALFGEGLANYNQFYREYYTEVNTVEKLFADKPHSFVFELILSFGLLFFPLYMLFYYQMFKIIKYSLGLGVSFLLITFVPGTIFLMPCFFVLIYLSSERYTSKNRHIVKSI